MIKAFSKARKQNINNDHAADATPASADEDEVAFIKTLGLRYPELMNPKDWLYAYAPAHVCVGCVCMYV